MVLRDAQARHSVQWGTKVSQAVCACRGAVLMGVLCSGTLQLDPELPRSALLQGLLPTASTLPSSFQRLEMGLGWGDV
jgi:hypothetical protein